MTTPPVDLPAGLDRLRDLVRGRVWLPGDTEFAVASRPWNLAVEQHVVAVVEAADAADVATLVRHASQLGIGVSTQPSGHGATGSASGTILLRTGRLDGIRIDPGTGRARVGAGVQSGALQRAVAPHGLTGLPGSSPIVSVTGATLGGGLSWFGRAFGWMADSVTAIEIVDATGESSTVTADADPDLFWALRGGGGDYAIVTALELALRPAPAVAGGRVLWEGTHARAVAAAYRRMTEHAPRELTLWLEMLQFPGSEPMVAIDSTYLGPAADGARLMAEIDRLPRPLVDTRGPISVAELGSITAEPTEPGAGVSRGELLTHLEEDTLAPLLDEPLSPVVLAQIRHLGGAFAQPSDGPLGPLTEPYALYLFGAPSDTASAGAIAARQADLVARLPVSGRKPVSFLNPTERLADALPATSIERLRRIKAQRDPGRVIRSNFSALD